MIWSLEFFIHIFISVTFISIFICIFFFTYATRVEKTIVVHQTKDLVDELTGTILNYPSLKKTLKPYIDDWKPPDMTSEDNKVAKANKVIVNKAVYIIGFSATTMLVFLLCLAYIYNISFYSLIVPNLIILFLVAVTEFCFLTFIAANYISFDPNYIRYKILNVLKEFSKSPTTPTIVSS